MGTDKKGFTGDRRFLSNFYSCEVQGFEDAAIYPSLEHAYQAAKTEDPQQKWMIQFCATAADAKRMGKTVKIRKHWEIIKLSVMMELLEKKFLNNPDLAQKLLDTGDEELIEYNWWGDEYWGVSLKTGKGNNVLGKLLMIVRESLKRNQTVKI